LELLPLKRLNPEEDNTRLDESFPGTKDLTKKRRISANALLFPEGTDCQEEQLISSVTSYFNSLPILTDGQILQLIESKQNA